MSISQSEVSVSVIRHCHNEVLKRSVRASGSLPAADPEPSGAACPAGGGVPAGGAGAPRGRVPAGPGQHQGVGARGGGP